jgi:hypothetical protein
LKLGSFTKIGTPIRVLIKIGQLSLIKIGQLSLIAWLLDPDHPES